MTTLTTIVTIISAVEVIFGVILIPMFVGIRNLTNADKCQLRSEMLRIYYNNKEDKKIRQYELENFVFLYKAYKTLKGNSFIDKIYEEVMKWEVIT